MQKTTFTINNQFYEINLSDWCFAKDRTCVILKETQEKLVLQNQNGIKFSIPKNLVKSNNLSIKNNTIELTEGLYQTYLLKPEKTRIDKRKNKLFKKHREAIFKHPEIAFKRPEFLLIRPSVFNTNAAYINMSLQPSLGEMLYSIQSENHLYYDELDGHQDVYVVQMSGSPLSGSYAALLWSKTEEKFICINTRQIISSTQLPGSFIDNLTAFINGFSIVNLPKIDFEDKAIERLIKCISTKTKLKSAEI